MSISSARPFESEAGTLEVSCLPFTVILGVVYAGNNIIYKVKCSHHRLKQESGWCNHRATSMMAVPVKSCIYR